jgi:hypothetical protein
MIGFIIGTACLAALVGIGIRRRRWAWAHGYGYGHGCGGRGRGWGGHDWDGPGAGFARGGFRGVVLRQLFSRLETTPGQEKAIGAAVENLVTATKKAREEIDASRADVARTIGSEVFDEGALGAAYARWDEAIASVRKAIADTLSTAHEALDERQRSALADVIAKGPRGFRGGFDHPYRSL